jgi:predicted unusual protein kinase regulating ubiquinone biosynthesis (AarF/ABC1/UbiB family)
LASRGTARQPSRRSRVPESRAQRLSQIGLLAGGLALGGAAEAFRRLGGVAPSAGHILLSGANGRRLANSLASMRGAAMKLGQLLSLEADDLLSAEVAEALAQLRDNADAMPREQLLEVMARVYGDDWRARFRDFEEEPIAAASIGQVHAARSLDGHELAVKVQYPGVASSIDSDIDNLATAFRLARILPGELDFDPLVAEAKRQLRNEADYEMEAGHLRRYGELMADEPEVVVPQVHEHLSTPLVLAMGRLRGVPLEDLCSPEYDQSERDSAAALLLRLALREIIEFGFVQSDPNFANYMRLDDGRIGLLDLGAGYELPGWLVEGYAALFLAAIDDDYDGLCEATRRIGFVSDEDGDAAQKAVGELVWLATEPFRASTSYDFESSNLAARARSAGTALVLEHGHLRPPPPQALYVQRKLGGTFLLCMRLRARVDARSLVERALAGHRGASAPEAVPA